MTIKLILKPLLIVLLLSGCTTYSVRSDLPCPARPSLEPVTIAEQQLINPQVIRKLADNQIKLKAYAKKLEARANCE